MNILSFFLWWLTIFIIGLIFLPITTRIFRDFYDKGYLFSKTFGLAVSSYVMWFFASARMLSFTRENTFSILGLCFAVVLTLIIKYQFHDLLKIKWQTLKVFIWQESIFIVCLGFWTYLRGMKPQLEGLEKFMDYGFVNSILKSQFFPPLDMWLANKPINYYYFGHYVTAFLTRISGVDSPIAYNLMMATLFAFTCVLVMSLIFNLLKKFYPKNSLGIASMVGAGVGAALIGMGGNLHSFLFGVIIPTLKNFGVTFPKNLKIDENYWFPDATRYIGHNPPANDMTIHEFPHYSFIVSDLHAHVINMVFVITLLAILFVYLRDTYEKSRNDELVNIWKPYGLFYIVPFFIGIFQMTNFWDFPIYLTVSFYIFLYCGYIRHKNIMKAFLESAIFSAYNFALSYVFAFFFNFNFEKITNGIRMTPTHTAIYQFFVVWGYQLFFSASFLILLFIAIKNRNYSSFKESKIYKKTKKTARLANIAPEEVTLLSSVPMTDVFCAILCICAIGLLFIPEIIYVKDIYEEPYHRSNTMFKLTYQSYIMFTIVAGYVCIRLFNFKISKITKNIYMVLVPLFIFLPLFYCYYTIPGWYGSFATTDFKTLDGGINYMSSLKNYKDEYEYPVQDDMYAINWLIKNEPGSPNIIEAPGDSYTQFGRVSVCTGLPTIIGWKVHEWLWHNSAKVPDDRNAEVDAFYGAQSPADARPIIDKYSIKYVIIGELERKRYEKKMNEEILTSLGEVKKFGRTTLVIIK